MTCQSRRIIEQIKVIGKIEDFQANNGTNFTDGVLQFGGNPLLHDTIIGGNFKLEFGPPGDYINTFIVRAKATQYFETYNGTTYATVSIYPNQVNISNSPSSGGLFGAYDYSPNMNDGRYYVQKIYVDNRIAGKNITNAVANPGSSENGKVISWNNATGEWVMAAPGAAPTAGIDTQVIFNQLGVLVGHPNFTFTPLTNFLSVPHIFLGHPGLGGTDRFISVNSNVPNTNLILLPKGNGYIHLGIDTGLVFIGRSDSPNGVQAIRAENNGSQADIALEPKGTDGRVFVGNIAEAGGFRYLAARGAGGNITQVIEPKGNGNIQLSVVDDTVGTIGNVVVGRGDGSIIGTGVKQLYAISGRQITNFAIGGTGTGSTVYIGRLDEGASSRFISPGSSSPNCNLIVNAFGSGRVFVNNFATIKYSIGGWDMVTTTNKNALHFVPDHTKILAVNVIIISNVGDRYSLSHVAFPTGIADGGGIYQITSVHVALSRMNPGFFANSAFSGTGTNRGWIYITYEL